MNRSTRLMGSSKNAKSRRGHSMSIIRSNVFNDPRDFTNKRNKKAILRRLFRLLEENEIQHTFVYQKWLKDTPLTKNVLFLFEWLFRMLDENFELKYTHRTGKEVIDYQNIYKLIKILSYQGKLKENDLRSLLPHSWNSCVFVFDLLMEMINYSQVNKEEIPPNHCIQRGLFNFYQSYLRRVYPEFMTGLDEGKRNQWRKNILGDIENEIRKLHEYVNQCQTEIESLEEQYKEMQSETNNMLAIERTRRELKDDLRKVRSRIKDVRRKNKEIVRSTEHEDLQAFRLNGEIRQLETILEELRHQVPVPYSSVSDGQQLKQKYLKKTRVVSEARGEVEALKREVLELEQETERIERENNLTIHSLNTRIQSGLTKGFDGIDESWILENTTPRNSRKFGDHMFSSSSETNNDNDVFHQINRLEQVLEERNRMSLPAMRRVQIPSSSSYIHPPPPPASRKKRMIDEDESEDESEDDDDDDDDDEDDDIEIDEEVTRGSITQELSQLIDVKNEIESEERRSFEMNRKFQNMIRKNRDEQGEMKQIMIGMFDSLRRLYKENENDIQEVGRMKEELKERKNQVYSANSMNNNGNNNNFFGNNNNNNNQFRRM